MQTRVYEKSTVGDIADKVAALVKLRLDFNMRAECKPSGEANGNGDKYVYTFTWGERPAAAAAAPEGADPDAQPEPPAPGATLLATEAQPATPLVTEAHDDESDRAALDRCTAQVGCTAGLHLSGCPARGMRVSERISAEAQHGFYDECMEWSRSHFGVGQFVLDTAEDHLLIFQHCPFTVPHKHINTADGHAVEFVVAGQ